MVRFKWTSQLAVFLPEIDAEHRGLYRTADELYRNVMARADAERVLAGARNLLLQVEEHFVHEEQLMRDARYAAFAWHKQQHDTFRKRARSLRPLIESGDRSQVLELLEFAHTWLKDHTGVADRMMGARLRNFGRARLAS
jgi:hemerythrin-like metal-binding protein